jgi:hypothetical protein
VPHDGKGGLLCGVGEVSLNSIAVARRLSFLSALVEVGAFAFLATELNDVAEGAIGGVADQPKTTATVGAPLHAILPSLQFCNPPERRANAATLRDVAHIRVSSVIRIAGPADHADHNPADLKNERITSAHRTADRRGEPVADVSIPSGYGGESRSVIRRAKHAD